MADLTPRQRMAILALLTSRGIRDAAKQAKIGERTLYRWLATEDFQEALRAAEDDAVNQATRRLIDLQDAAVDEIKTILTSAKDPALRLRTALAVLNTVTQRKDRQTDESRLLALEEEIQRMERSTK